MDAQDPELATLGNLNDDCLRLVAEYLATPELLAFRSACRSHCVAADAVFLRTCFRDRAHLLSVHGLQALADMTVIPRICATIRSLTFLVATTPLYSSMMRSCIQEDLAKDVADGSYTSHSDTGTPVGDDELAEDDSKQGTEPDSLLQTGGEPAAPSDMLGDMLSYSYHTDEPEIELWERQGLFIYRAMKCAHHVSEQEFMSLTEDGFSGRMFTLIWGRLKDTSQVIKLVVHALGEGQSRNNDWMPESMQASAHISEDQWTHAYGVSRALDTMKRLLDLENVSQILNDSAISRSMRPIISITSAAHEKDFRIRDRNSTAREAHLTELLDPFLRTGLPLEQLDTQLTSASLTPFLHLQPDSQLTFGSLTNFRLDASRLGDLSCKQLQDALGSCLAALHNIQEFALRGSASGESDGWLARALLRSLPITKLRSLELTDMDLQCDTCCCMLIRTCENVRDLSLKRIVILGEHAYKDCTTWFVVFGYVLRDTSIERLKIEDLCEDAEKAYIRMSSWRAEEDLPSHASTAYEDDGEVDNFEASFLWLSREDIEAGVVRLVEQDL